MIILNNVWYPAQMFERLGEQGEAFVIYKFYEPELDNFRYIGKCISNFHYESDRIINDKLRATAVMRLDARTLAENSLDARTLDENLIEGI